MVLPGISQENLALLVLCEEVHCRDAEKKDHHYDALAKIEAAVSVGVLRDRLIDMIFDMRCVCVKARLWHRVILFFRHLDPGVISHGEDRGESKAY